MDLQPSRHSAVQAAGRVAGLWRRVRWVAAVFCLVQFVAYVPSPGVRAPWSPVVVGTSLALLTGLVNVVAQQVERRRPRRSGLEVVARRDVLLLAADTAIVAAVVLLFAFEPVSAVWVLLVVPVLEAGLVGRLRCAFTVSAVAVGTLVTREVMAVQLHHLPAQSAGELVSGLGFRVGVLLLAAAAVAVQASVAVQHLRLLHQTQLQLVHDAGHDGLTGLATRRLFLDEAGRAVRHRRHADGALAVLFVDCDDFKTVNDTHGHAAGDQVLQQVAERLRALTGEADVAARLGGDEFAVLLHLPGHPSRSGDDDALPGGMVAALRTALAVPYAVGGRDPVAMSCSVGVAVCRDGDTLPGLLRRADEAMYADKASAGPPDGAAGRPGVRSAEPRWSAPVQPSGPRASLVDRPGSV